MKNDLPNWLNYTLIFVIFGLLIIGAIPFLSPEFSYDPNSDFLAKWHSMVPSFLSIVVYFLIIFLKTLFSYDFGTIISILLIFSGVAMWTFTINLKDEIDKNITYSIATALIGLGSGMPIGRSLSKLEKKDSSTDKQA